MRTPAPRCKAVLGQSMTEFLLLASFVSVALLAAPVIASLGQTRLQAAVAARLLAWERSVWMSDKTSADDLATVSGAIVKSDAELTRDLARHVFRDRRQDALSIHSEGAAEFAYEAPAMAPGVQVVASTTEHRLPVVLDAVDDLRRQVRRVQKAISGEDLTTSLSKFTLLTGGYYRAQVDVTDSSSSMLARPHSGFIAWPNAHISEQVTMLTEAWNASGTMREEAKIQGLVPTKLLEAPFWRPIRSSLHQTAYQIKQVNPAFETSLLMAGFQPGDAWEGVPFDRFEQRHKDDGTGELKPGSFRYYRSFPPPPVVNTLP